MRNSGRGDRSPTVRLGAGRIRHLEGDDGTAPNLFDNRLYVWQSLDVVRLRRALVSDDAIKFFLCPNLNVGEIYEGKNECL